MAPREPVQILRWARGWYLVGNGPSYLLFCPNKEVLHLSSGLHRQLRRDLKGYTVIGKDGKLEPLVWALTQISADVIHDADPRPDAATRMWANTLVLHEIEMLIHQFPPSCSKIFEGSLRRLATLIRAARILQLYHGPPDAPGAPSQKSPPGSFFTGDQSGQRLLVMSNPHFVFRCEPNSPIAQCAQKLWRREGATVLYRVPTRRELREFLCLDDPAVTKLCHKEGFDWLPRAPSSRVADGKGRA
jgi:hypothetical protein